ncbi:sulfotransferase 1B1-like [Ylistrum balloti]|uniref:sulfotransferase 1B1-like n=1 Tax=Ylistrum balloti TaxID=509963 RepID=UPI002905DE45|nr:sulfotransferase 1B1-like [Ylistrum balloti]
MEFIKKTDSKGNTIIFKRYQGRPFHKEIPGNVGDQLEKVASLPCCSDDVLICTFPKSGTHWVFNIVNMIQTGSLRYKANPVMIEFQDLEILDEMKSPKILTTHLTYPFIPKAAKEGQMKLIYVLRNPKDVVCSYFTYMSQIQCTSYIGNFGGFFEAFLTHEFISCGGSWFTHTREWSTALCENKDLKILYLTYEDLKENLKQNINKIAKFLEVEREESFLVNVEHTVAFGNLKNIHATSAGENELLKHYGDNGRLPLYNKGIVGGWKNVFTVAQNEKFDAIYKENMSGMGNNIILTFE